MVRFLDSRVDNSELTYDNMPLLMLMLSSSTQTSISSGLCEEIVEDINKNKQKLSVASVHAFDCVPARAVQGGQIWVQSGS